MLSDEEKLLFSRQIVLPNFGLIGQEKLKKARILVVGIGGLGTFSSLLLAEMGVGYLRIVDRDLIEKSNLNRTPLYNEDDLDHAKVEIAAQRLQLLNPKLTLDTHACHINKSNISALLEDIDIVIDGLDNFDTRRIINQECVKRGIPFVFCGVSGHVGNIAVFNVTHEQPCLSCLYHEINDDDLESCDITGIHPALLAIMTGFQVHEAVNILLHSDTTLNSSLLFVDLQNMSFNKIQIHKNKECKVCSSEIAPVSQKISSDYYSLNLCGPASFMLVSDDKNTINYQFFYEKIRKDYKLLKEGKLAFTFQYSNKIRISVFKGGNILIRGEESRQTAENLWYKLYKNFNK
ncbi:MAG: HesA/MoeB/ThiF family protein [Candidatus Hodarchaeales archaeon]